MPFNPSGYPAQEEIDGNLRVRDIYNNGLNGNMTVDNAFWAGSMLGMVTLTGGGAVTPSMISGAMALGVTGFYLDPTKNWSITQLVIADGNKNFKIKSLMSGSIGWNGQVNLPATYVTVSPGSGTDGIQLYTLNPTTAPTTGFVFEDVVLVGSCPGGSVLHLGGGQRECGIRRCLVYNTSSATNSYGVTNDTALSGNNGENNIFDFIGGGGIAGNYAALAWGIGDTSGHPNDTTIYDLRTSGGTYSIVHYNGGGLTLVSPYDRSNPTTAVLYQHGGRRMTVIGGEWQNTTGQLAILDTSSSFLHFIDVALTNGGSAGATMFTCSAGSTLTFSGECDFNTAQVLAISGASTIVDMSDPLVTAASCTISGSTGTVYVAEQYSGSAPILTSFTGTVTNPYYPANTGSWTSLTPLNSYANSGSGPNLEFRQVNDQITIVGDVTAPATPNVVLATLPTGSNVTKSQMLQCIDRTSGAESAATARIQGSPASITIAGATSAHEYAISGTVYSDA